MTERVVVSNTELAQLNQSSEQVNIRIKNDEDNNLSLTKLKRSNVPNPRVQPNVINLRSNSSSNNCWKISTIFCSVLNVGLMLVIAWLLMQIRGSDDRAPFHKGDNCTDILNQTTTTTSTPTTDINTLSPTVGKFTPSPIVVTPSPITLSTTTQLPLTLLPTTPLPKTSLAPTIVTGFGNLTNYNLSFTMNITSGSAPLPVGFSIDSGNPEFVLMDFNGNGHYIQVSQENINHQYLSVDIYSPSMIAVYSDRNVSFTWHNAIAVMGAMGTLYCVGSNPIDSNQACMDLSNLRTDLLGQDDVVQVHSGTYHNKLLFKNSGYSFVGVYSTRDGEGNRPVLNFIGATTNLGFNFANEDRGGVTINSASDIIFSGFRLTGAISGMPFTDDSGISQEYSSNTAAVRVLYAGNITITDSIFCGNENGLFVSSAITMLIEYCQFFNNSVSGSQLTHGIYVSGSGVKFIAQFNSFGGVKDGHNLKTLAFRNIVNYNYFSCTPNYCLDYVSTGTPELNLIGNIFEKVSPIHNKAILHVAGQGGTNSGTANIFYNTIISTDQQAYVFSLGSEVRTNFSYNVYYSSYSTNILSSSSSSDYLYGTQNSISSLVNDNTNGRLLQTQTFSDPNFVQGSYRPDIGSPLCDVILNPSSNTSELYPKYEYTHQRRDTAVDVGSLQCVG